MKAILVFIDGTICDTRPRRHLSGTPGFYQRSEMLQDLAVTGSVRCLKGLAQRYGIIYIGARPDSTLPCTEEWLTEMGFPEGPVYLAETHKERFALARELRERYDFIAGIGDRWDDNELHSEIGGLSVILQEFEGNWDTVPERIIEYHREQRIRENEIHLAGKIEGLARVLPLVLPKYGEELWETYFQAVLEMAENSRETRKKEDLQAFEEHGLNPEDLRDAAKLDEIMREEDWEDNPVYGLQDFELVEATDHRYVHKVTRCLYAELWREHGRPDIGYQIHCHTDMAWWDRPAWNPQVRFEQPKTLMQGDDYCLFIQHLPDDSND